MRIDAAAALLPHRPRVAKAILDQAAGRSLTARYVLSEWGRSSTPAVPDESEAEESARARITRFYATIDERFDFLGSLGFRRTITGKTGSRAAQARWEGGGRYLEITYDTIDGTLDTYVGGGEFDGRDSVWEIMAVRGAWQYSGYTGHTMDAMREGIELAARHLDAHRDLLIADLNAEERMALKRRRADLLERAAALAKPDEPKALP